MILTEFPFEDFCDKTLFSGRWEKTLSALSRQRIVNIFGVWDNTSGEWFGEAPMLVELENGTLAVNVRSGKYLALAWNKILSTEKPRWFPENTEIPDWREDLDWRVYSPLCKFRNTEVLRVEVVGSENALNGLRFKTDEGGFLIADAGDVITGISDE